MRNSGLLTFLDQRLCDFHIVGNVRIKLFCLAIYGRSLLDGIVRNPAMLFPHLGVVCVPEPVCQTTSGNSSACCPSKISSHVAMMASLRVASSLPRSQFTIATAFFSKAKPFVIFNCSSTFFSIIFETWTVSLALSDMKLCRSFRDFFPCFIF